MAETDRTLIIGWLAKLAIRCVPRKTEDLELTIRTYAAPMAADLPAHAFSDASLEAVSRQYEHFPAYAGLRKALDKWLEDNKVATPLPGRLNEAPFGTAERVNAVVWLNAAAANVSTSELATRLDVLRGKLPSVFRWLVENDHRARFIAEDHGWAEADHQSWQLQDPAVVLAKVRSIVGQPHFATPILLRILRTAVERHAPQNAGFVPEDVSDLHGEPSHDQRTTTPAQATEIRADEGIVRVNKPEDTEPAVSGPAAQFYAKHGRPPGSLSAAALQATRMANPLLKPIAEQAALQTAKATLHAEPPTAVFDPDDPPLEDVPAYGDKPFPWNLLPDDEDTNR